MGETLPSCFSVYQKDVWGLSGQIDLVCNQLKNYGQIFNQMYFSVGFLCPQTDKILHKYIDERADGRAFKSFV